MNEKLEKMVGVFYNSRQDIMVELNNMGIDVWEENHERIIAGYVDKETQQDVMLRIRIVVMAIKGKRVLVNGIDKI